MNGLVEVLAALVLGVLAAQAADTPSAEAVHAAKDLPLTTETDSSFWRRARPIYLEKDIQGKSVSGFRAEVRALWTKNNLYLLFSCPYDELYLKPSPDTNKETNELWNWDVAEIFISSNFKDIKRYQEFEVSPQGEWIDLDIDLHKPHHEDGWTWNSKFETSARIDTAAHRWYAAMRIPFSAIGTRLPASGTTFRMNLFLSEGPPSRHRELTWQPPMSNTFHVPERFGLLKLIGDK